MAERLLAHLAHVEVVTPKPEESLWFYRDILGLEVTAQDGDSVYLRGWGEHYAHSLQLTEGPQPAIAHTGWRTEGAQELEALAKRLDELGVAEGWVDDQFGHGRAFRYRGPGGHLQELFWEVDRYEPPAELAPVIASRPQRYISRGAGARRIDHVTVNSWDPYAEAEWYRDNLGYRFMEYSVLDVNPDIVVTAFVSTAPNSHDLGIVREASGQKEERKANVHGRVNHIAFWLDQREDVMKAADVYVDAGLQIEYGPGRHGIGENLFLYVREPGGMRVELFSGGYQNQIPDWEPVRHTASRGVNYWTPHLAPPAEYLFEAFPPLEEERD